MPTAKPQWARQPHTDRWQLVQQARSTVHTTTNQQLHHDDEARDVVEVYFQGTASARSACSVQRSKHKLCGSIHRQKMAKKRGHAHGYAAQKTGLRNEAATMRRNSTARE